MGRPLTLPIDARLEMIGKIRHEFSSPAHGGYIEARIQQDYRSKLYKITCTIVIEEGGIRVKSTVEWNIEKTKEDCLKELKRKELIHFGKTFISEV